MKTKSLSLEQMENLEGGSWKCGIMIGLYAGVVVISAATCAASVGLACAGGFVASSYGAIAMGEACGF